MIVNERKLKKYRKTNSSSLIAPATWSTNLSSPWSFVCRIWYLWPLPYSIFVFIPTIRLIQRKKMC